MANCANCGRRITAFNSDPHFNFSDQTLCQNCSDTFNSLLMDNKMGWNSVGITRRFIRQNKDRLRLNDSGIEFLLSYADYIQKNNPDGAEDEEDEEKLEEEELKRKEEDLEKRIALSKMLISSGFNFEGYRIVKYSGYISGDDAIQIPRSGIFDRGRNGENLTDALVKIRRRALIELKEAAYDLGCNAVIGVDFDYLTLDPETASLTGGTVYEPYVICVTANGNAVVIEKIED
ncbi:MAG: heavy metal-binding domain-containing protein [Oscillospiraceae bacterium]|nr:heavy metal-binding domain-containing protein [Oscillospiraceae bacterium]